MNALIFPGQGSQAVGMGSEFYNKFDLVKKIFRQADERLGFSITDIIFNGPEDKLQLTKNTQPAILTVSYSIFKVLKHEFGFNLNSFKYFAGHSLGEYSALVCSEALNFEDAIYLLHERGKAMQDAVPLGEGRMLAVLGLDINKINDFLSIIKEDSGVCEIANDNANGQIILSGNKKNIELIQKNLKEKKIKSIPLKVSAPFHCSLMKPAAKSMEKKINLTKLNNTLHQIVSNVTAKPENDTNLIKKLLIDQIFSTVRWRESIINMNNLGVNNFLEIGPGKVLTSMVKRTIDNVNSFSINSIADIESIENEFKK
tara:strand:- start:716 stop:1657 length:942 start_codon:yes stop_codon:yes gene_type:complete